MRKLENPQKAILDFIVAYTESNAYPPSVREICDAVGLKSTSTVHTHLRNMEARGLITRDASKQRAMVVLQRPEAADPAIERAYANAVPLVGKVAAGVPILAEENVEDAYPLPEFLLRNSQPGEVFMLRVQGDSMVNAGIQPDDVLVVNRGLRCENGEIAVARLEGETATVKRIYQEKDCVRLQPENDRYQPILAPYDSVEIVGRVIGLIRPFR